jgi:hypothetical protein
MYRSKHDAKLPPSCSSFGLQGSSKLTANESGTEDPLFGKSAANGKPAATFGKEVITSIDPTSFMKKGAKTKPAAPDAKPFQRSALLPSRPGVPKRTEKPVMGLTTEKNFVVANAVENILAVPRRPPKEAPLATQAKSFGKVPGYLGKIKRDVEQEREYVQQLSRQQHAGEQDRMRMMTEDEKNDIISGLKKKWEDTHKQYQALTFNIDTVTKVQRKEGLEVEMEQIEKAIQKLSKKNIHVYDDSDLW